MMPRTGSIMLQQLLSQVKLLPVGSQTTRDPKTGDPKTSFRNNSFRAYSSRVPKISNQNFEVKQQSDVGSLAIDLGTPTRFTCAPPHRPLLVTGLSTHSLNFLEIPCELSNSVRQDSRLLHMADIKMLQSCGLLGSSHMPRSKWPHSSCPSP